MITWEDVRRSRMNWKLQRETQYRASEKPLDRELPPKRLEPHPRLEQMEMESIVAPIDDNKAFIRHREALARRWLSYYQKAKGLKNSMNLARQYGIITRMRGGR